MEPLTAPDQSDTVGLARPQGLSGSSASGQSAGGVEALRELLPGLPGGNVAYIIAQHMSPVHPSLLLEVLSRESELELSEITDGLPLRAGTIFMSRPNCDVEVSSGRFRTRQASPRISPQPSIDVLLRSLARECGDHAIAVTLSFGTGAQHGGRRGHPHRRRQKCGARPVVGPLPGHAGRCDRCRLHRLRPPSGRDRRPPHRDHGGRRAGRFPRALRQRPRRWRRWPGRHSWPPAGTSRPTRAGPWAGSSTRSRRPRPVLPTGLPCLRRGTPLPRLATLRDSMLINVTCSLRDRAGSSTCSERPATSSPRRSENSPCAGGSPAAQPGEEAYSVAIAAGGGQSRVRQRPRSQGFRHRHQRCRHGHRPSRRVIRWTRWPTSPEWIDRYWSAGSRPP